MVIINGSNKTHRSKRKKSCENSDVEKSDIRSKSVKYGEEPSGSTALIDDTIGNCRISEFLQNVNSVLYGQLKVIYKGCFKSFVALYADRICSDQHFVENCIEKFPSG